MVSIAVEASELADCGLDRLSEGILANCEIVEVGDENCALDGMDDDARRLDSDITEADDEGPPLSSSELDSAGVDIAEWVKSELIENDEVSVLSKRELDGLTGNDVFVLNG
ncbi:hypothetical protein [Endozoicomonas sp. ALB115]|uniref:hypothetical protein n=1 Tax=Endozoicomonas sp. ALB115 TaxID=3403074 RepID=UPI003BB65838